MTEDSGVCPDCRSHGGICRDCRLRGATIVVDLTVLIPAPRRSAENLSR